MATCLEFVDKVFFLLKKYIIIIIIMIMMMMMMMMMMIIIIIISIITVFAGVLFVHQPGANHAPRASVAHSSQSFCSYTENLSEDSCRFQHADLLNLCHSSSL